jgi:hypothetical protein
MGTGYSTLREEQTASQKRKTAQRHRHSVDFRDPRSPRHDRSPIPSGYDLRDPRSPLSRRSPIPSSTGPLDPRSPRDNRTPVPSFPERSKTVRRVNSRSKSKSRRLGSAAEQEEPSTPLSLEKVQPLEIVQPIDAAHRVEVETMPEAMTSDAALDVTIEAPLESEANEQIEPNEIQTAIANELDFDRAIEHETAHAQAQQHAITSEVPLEQLFESESDLGVELKRDQPESIRVAITKKRKQLQSPKQDRPMPLSPLQTRNQRRRNSFVSSSNLAPNLKKQLSDELLKKENNDQECWDSNSNVKRQRVAVKRNSENSFELKRNNSLLDLGSKSKHSSLPDVLDLPRSSSPITLRL